MESLRSPDPPLPPLELRRLVGPTEPETFDNPNGEPIYGDLGILPEAYERVVDFGSGCGRVARQLLQQTPRPRRYTGIEVHPEMVAWCVRHLSPIDPDFVFHHHDVYSPNYAPGNSLRLAAPLPVPDRDCSLFIAHSVFTHLVRGQTEYYLAEVARILRPGGLAFTTWLFFDNESFPFLQEGPSCLFTSEASFAEAVIYDRRWVLDTVRRFNLCIRRTIPPRVPGHQWVVLLEPRRPESVDCFPLGAEGAEWLCGATRKPIARSSGDAEGRPPIPFRAGRPDPPPLFGPLAELAALRAELAALRAQLDAMRRS